MKKQSENQPIDDLFARKLGKMSLPPSPDGFGRLQARMGQGKPEARLVFWRNPEMQRYMTAAACLLLICLFGWLYWPSTSTLSEQQVATNKLPHTHKSIQNQDGQPMAKQTPEEIRPGQSNQEQESAESQVAKVSKKKVANDVGATKGVESQIAEVTKPMNRVKNQLSNSPVLADKNRIKSAPVLTNEQPVLAQTQPATNGTKPAVPTSTDVVPASPSTPERLAENTVKPTPPVERVLVVTIAEPESLVAARQAKAVVAEKPVVAVTEKPERESKAGGLWQQVKRIKQGELFARHDNPGDDDRGLLGRAYNGLKQSFDKDKSIKQ